MSRTITSVRPFIDSQSTEESTALSRALNFDATAAHHKQHQHANRRLQRLQTLLFRSTQTVKCGNIGLKLLQLRGHLLSYQLLTEVARSGPFPLDKGAVEVSDTVVSSPITHVPNPQTFIL